MWLQDRLGWRFLTSLRGKKLNGPNDLASDILWNENLVELPCSIVVTEHLPGALGQLVVKAVLVLVHI